MTPADYGDAIINAVNESDGYELAELFTLPLLGAAPGAFTPTADVLIHLRDPKVRLGRDVVTAPLPVLTALAAAIQDPVGASEVQGLPQGAMGGAGNESPGRCPETVAHRPRSPWAESL